MSQHQSKRFQTTLSSALEATAQRFGEMEDRSQVVKNLRDRKLNNTRTSIVFGFDSVNYESDAMSRQKDILQAFSGGSSASQLSDAKELKKSLVRSNFRIGDQEEKVEYQSSASRSMGNEAERSTWQNIQKYRGTLDPKIDKFIKSSSVHMGSDSRSFSTAAQDAMTYTGQQIDYTKTYQDCQDLKKALTRHHFELAHRGGELSVADKRVSSQNASYTYDQASFSGARAVMSKETLADLRREHFSLGYSNETDYSRAAGHGVRTLEDVQKDRERATALKQALLKTSVVIGDDDEYM